MKKIFIFGAAGFFGSHFVELFNKAGWEVIKDRVDITDYSAIKRYLVDSKPDAVINAAGKTGRPNVDWCEIHKNETMSVNVQGAINIALATNELGIYFVHIGSGCIYEGDNNGTGFAETDEPNFYGSFYSRTKIYSEKALAEFNPLQLRVRIPIEGKSCPKNVIDKLVNYERIISIPNSFTIVEDFMTASYELIKNKERGVFNMTNVGFMDHEYLMSNYTKIVDFNKKFSYMTLDELGEVTKAKRSNCVLSTDKREALGVQMPDIKKRIPEILEDYKKNITS